jgi:hypothetical protein
MPYHGPLLPNLFMQPRPLYLVPSFSTAYRLAPRLTRARTDSVMQLCLNSLGSPWWNMIFFVSLLLSQGIIFAGICAISPMRRS